jgi:hypothetical protein
VWTYLRKAFTKPSRRFIFCHPLTRLHSSRYTPHINAGLTYGDTLI